MTDITKCNGDGCPKKENGYRYTCQASEYQSWAEFNPKTPWTCYRPLTSWENEKTE